MATSFVFGVSAVADGLGIDVALLRGDAGQRDHARFLEGPERAAYRVVLQVGGDDVVARPDRAP